MCLPHLAPQESLSHHKFRRLTGLYAGLESSLLGISVTNFVYYYFYEAGRAFILQSREGSKGLSTRESLLNGCIAGTSLATLTSVTQKANYLHRLRNGLSLESALGDPDQAGNSDRPSRRSNDGHHNPKADNGRDRQEHLQQAWARCVLGRYWSGSHLGYQPRHSSKPLAR